MSMIKVNRAIKLSTIGDCPASLNDMLAVIPIDVVEALPARLLAQLIDANWRLAQSSKAAAMREAIDEGAVWDARQECVRELRA